MVDIIVNECLIVFELVDIVEGIVVVVCVMGYEFCVVFFSYLMFGNLLGNFFENIWDVVVLFEFCGVGFEFEGEMVFDVVFNLKVMVSYLFS